MSQEQPQPRFNWIDQMTWDEVTGYLKQNRPADALLGLTILAKAYPDNQQIQTFYQKVSQYLAKQSPSPTTSPLPNQPATTPAQPTSQDMLTQAKHLIVSGRSQEALPILYKLAAAFPNNQEVAGLIADIIAPAPKAPLIAPPPQQVYQPAPIYYAPPLPIYNVSPRHPPNGFLIWWKWFAIAVLPLLAVDIVLGIIIYYMSYQVVPLYQLDNQRNTINLVSNLTTLINFAIVIATSIWACVDADNWRRRGGQDYISHPAGVILFCLLLWFAGFPTYLADRETAKFYLG